jgi:hypothetical protein
MRDTGWFKSTFSTSGGDNCVEVRFTGDASLVRDSKNPAAELAVDLPALVSSVRAGRLTGQKR